VAELHKCDNCGAVFDDDSLPKTLFEVNHLAERLDPGSVVPSGECACGALTYLHEEPSAVDQLAEIANAG
jgi:hypothetical protein